jgi:tRNA (guanine37-N1)-methyltransferase
MMRFDILSLFPQYFKGPFDESLIKRAREKGLVEINLIDIRDFAENKWRKVDDRPYGGGPGMVLMPEPVTKAIRSVRKPESRVIYLSPQGTPFSAIKASQLATQSHLVLLCGHYEGIDERVLEAEIDEEISIGDYVLTNGGPAAIILVDAILRFVPGFLGHPEAAAQDSFSEGFFDCPHYTQPLDFEGRKVPEILRSGHHKEIANWRRKEAEEKTRRVRPDLIKNLNVCEEKQR